MVDGLRKEKIARLAHSLLGKTPRRPSGASTLLESSGSCRHLTHRPLG
jgi:hypothetical protein